VLVGGEVAAGGGQGAGAGEMAEAAQAGGEVRPGVKGARGTARPATGAPHSPTYMQWHSRPGGSGTRAHAQPPCLRRVLRSSQKKNGLPSNAVSTPNGSSAGAATVRAVRSAANNTNAPSNALAGIRKR
jgi:hypothetical protein